MKGVPKLSTSINTLNISKTQDLHIQLVFCNSTKLVYSIRIFVENYNLVHRIVEQRHILRKNIIFITFGLVKFQMSFKMF